MKWNETKWNAYIQDGILTNDPCHPVVLVFSCPNMTKVTKLYILYHDVSYLILVCSDNQFVQW
jgi:hypothetical protein